EMDLLSFHAVLRRASGPVHAIEVEEHAVAVPVARELAPVARDRLAEPIARAEAADAVHRAAQAVRADLLLQAARHGVAGVAEAIRRRGGAQQLVGVHAGLRGQARGAQQAVARGELARGIAGDAA